MMEDQDPEEKHFIGDLLSDLAAEWHDDDVFRSSSNDTSRNSDGNNLLRSSAPKPQIEQPNPVGIPAGSTFAQWPEPPPPYSPPTSHGWYTGKPVIAVDTSVPPPLLDQKQAAAAMAFMQQAGMRLPPGCPPISMQQAGAQAPGFYNPFGAAAAAAAAGRHPSVAEFASGMQPTQAMHMNVHPTQLSHQSSDPHLLQSYAALHPESLHLHHNAAFMHKQQQQAFEAAEPEQHVTVQHHQQQQTPPVPLPKSGVSYSAAAAQHTAHNRTQRAQSTSSVAASVNQSSFTTSGHTNAASGNVSGGEGGKEKKSRHGSCNSCAKDATAARQSANNTPPLQHGQSVVYTGSTTPTAPLTSSNEFQKITGRKGKAAKQQQQQQQQQQKMGRKYSAAEVLPAAEPLAPAAEKTKTKTRFQVLVSEPETRARRPQAAAAVLQRDEDDDDDDSCSVASENNTGHATSNKSARADSLRQRGNKAGGSTRVAPGSRGPSGRKSRRGVEQTPIQLVLGWLCVLLQELLGYATVAAVWLRDLLCEVLVAIVDITAHGLRHAWQRICERSERIYHYCCERLYTFAVSIRHPRLWLDKLLFSRSSWRFWARNSDVDSDSWGLEETIQLPTTGDEAMRRLLLCKGQDAYSILGLRSDCSDEEIKRYYKRQAVLVHPDKNCSYGADEAFKILAAAFDMIGKPERREQYNLANIHRSKEMKQFELLMQQLRAKMDEVMRLALSTMQCDCGNKHHRYNTKRDPMACRFCRRCNDMHAAKDNDIWAESRWLGFLWYYYACIDGVVYDITEWKNPLKHMKANDHVIKYRLVSTKQTAPSGPTPRHDLPRLEKELTSRVNLLIHHMVNEERPFFMREAEVDAWLQRVQRTAASGSATSLLLDTLNSPFGREPTPQPQQQQQQQRERFSTPFGNQPSSSNDSMNAATASYRPPDRASTRKAGRRRKAK